MTTIMDQWMGMCRLWLRISLKEMKREDNDDDDEGIEGEHLCCSQYWLVSRVMQEAALVSVLVPS